MGEVSAKCGVSLLCVFFFRLFVFVAFTCCLFYFCGLKFRTPLLPFDFTLLTYLRGCYDTRIFERYEGPRCCPEEVSLTSITEEIRSIRINSFLWLPASGTTMPGLL